MTKTKTLLFFVIFFVILVSIQPFFMPSDYVKGYRPQADIYNSVYAEKENTLDVIFSGDSMSYTSFSPLYFWKRFGITSYNIGTASQKLTEGYEIIKGVFEKQKPKLLVLETNQFFAFSGNKVTAFNETVLRYVAKNVPIFEFHDRWKTFFMIKEALKGPEMRAIHKGWRVIEKSQKYDGRSYMIPTESRRTMDAVSLDYLNRILDLCKENNTKVMFVSTPSPKEWNMAKHNTVADLAKEKGIRYIDLNLELDAIKIDWETDTMDKGTHLNTSGALKVMSHVGDRIIDKNIIKTRKSHPVDVEWNENYRNHMSMILEKYGTILK